MLSKFFFYCCMLGSIALTIMCASIVLDFINKSPLEGLFAFIILGALCYWALKYSYNKLYPND